MKYSIVGYGETRSNSDFRIDAEYWRPDFIENATLVSGDRKISHFVERDISNIKTSPVDGDFQYLEISNILLDRPEYQTTTVQPGEEPDRAHYILRKEDVVVSTVRPNRNAVAFIEDDGIVGSSGLSVLRANNIEPKFLYLFCKTDYFVNCLMRANKASMYPAVSNHDVFNVPLFVPSDSFLSCVLPFVDDAFEMVHASNHKYAEAQYALLSEIGLAGWQPHYHPWFIKHYADLRKAERIDADYFQPKYDEIVNAIKACHGGWKTLGALVSIKKCIEVGSGEYLDKGIPFVRVSNLSPFEISKEKHISHVLYSGIKEHQPKQGEILLTKDATPGIAHYLKAPPEKMIPSGGILRLKTKADGINNEYLTLVLNSILTKEQVNRDVGGSVILHWRPDQVKGVVVPILPEEKQTQIAEKVTEAFALRKQSKHLLDCAKRAVEIAIEKNERAAVKWLEKEAGEM